MTMNKIAAAIALLMLLSTASMVLLPSVQSQETIVIKTYIFVTAQPDPVGVGQTATVFFALDKIPPWFPNGTLSGEYWQGITITVQKPDGTSQTLGPFESQSQASGWEPFVPTQTGNYTFQAHFPGQTLTVASTDTYGPSDSQKATLTVQEEPVPAYPSSPLPTEYWTRPIDAQLREWNVISGNWLGLSTGTTNSMVNLYSKGPETAHIAWTKELGIGGLIGGDHASDMYYTGLWYFSKIINPVVINGRLYQRTMSGPFQYKGTACIDIRTGEELWNKDGVFVSFGSVWYEEIGDIHGGIPILWGTGDITDEGIVPGWGEGVLSSSTWHMYDASTGDLIRTLENAGSGTAMFGPNGEVLVYMLDTTDHWLARWNSSAITDFITYMYGMWQWTPTTGPAIDWRDGIDLNVTIPDVQGDYGISGIDSGVIYARSTYSMSDWDVVASDVAFDLETGNKLWGPVNRTKTGAREMLAMADGVFVDWEKTAFRLTGYDVKTGTILWTNETDQLATDFLGMVASAAYGKLYLGDMGGHIYTLDLKKGNSVWKSVTGSSSFEYPFGRQGLGNAKLLIADGKVYYPTAEVEPFRPYWRGYSVICLDAATGQELWRSHASISTESES
jgi:PQQ-like domain